MTTYPNQRIVHIIKDKCKKDFLQINNDDWHTAGRCIEQYGTFKLYLYFASNKSDFTLALSPVAIEESIGISESTYRRAFQELLELGYLSRVEGKKNSYLFHSRI